MAKIQIGFELDNAETGQEISLLRDSYRSVLDSAKLFIQENSNSSCIVTKVTGEEQSIFFLTQLNDIESHYPELGFRSLINADGSYFGAKNCVSSDTLDAEIIVFCDSDCLYDLSYVSLMVETLCSTSSQIVYGHTYPALKSNSRFQEKAALWWLFPPKEIGYGPGWPRSQWMNNVAVEAKLLSSLRFPQVSIQVHGESGFRQIKVEGELWKEMALSSGASIQSSQARAHHRIYNSWSEFSERQFEHGLASAYMSKRSGRGRLYTLISPLGEPVKKLIALFALMVMGKLNYRLFFGSLPFFPVSLIHRLRGSRAFSQADVLVKNSNLALFWES